MKNLKNVVLSTFLGVVSFASLAAADYNTPQGNAAYSPQGGTYQSQGYSQDGTQGTSYSTQYRGTIAQPSSVENQRQFSPNDTSNEAISSRVLAALQNDSTFSTVQNVQVSAYDGAVTLTGTVKTDDERTKLETIAKKVSGVKSVSNKITVAK